MQLGISPAALAARLEGLSFAELEQFGQDVLRRSALRPPDSDARAIAAERLRQWAERLPAANRSTVRPALPPVSDGWSLQAEYHSGGMSRIFLTYSSCPPTEKRWVVPRLSSAACTRAV